MNTTSQIASEHAGLLNVTDVKPLSDQDKQCFIELKEVLKRHGALQRFGVTLLHTHFPIYEGEVLVEECDEQNRTLTLKPVKHSTLRDESLLQTNWRLDTEDSVQACQGYCVMTKDGHGGPAHRTI
jgi:hypothetical protein